VRGLAPRIAACADEIERLRRLPDTLVDALHEAGFFTVAQQLQGRDDHYENAGKFLLGLEPDTTWL
jgi:hypothetical protein